MYICLSYINFNLIELFEIVMLHSIVFLCLVNVLYKLLELCSVRSCGIYGGIALQTSLQSFSLQECLDNCTLI